MTEKMEVKNEVGKIEKVEANIGGILAIVSLIGTILPYIMKILEALGGTTSDKN